MLEDTLTLEISTSKPQVIASTDRLQQMIHKGLGKYGGELPPKNLSMRNLGIDFLAGRRRRPGSLAVGF